MILLSERRTTDQSSFSRVRLRMPVKNQRVKKGISSRCAARKSFSVSSADKIPMASPSLYRSRNFLMARAGLADPESGEVFRYHCWSHENRNWKCEPFNRYPLTPLVLGGLKMAVQVHFHEGQFDPLH